MTDFAGDDLDERLDRACAASETAPPAEAIDALRALLPELHAQAARLPDSASALDDLARRSAAEGRAVFRAGRHDESLALTRAAIQLHTDAASLDPAGGARIGPIASLRLRCAEVLDHAQRLGEALAETEGAAAQAESLAAEDPSDPRPTALAMDCRRAAGSLRGRMGDVPGAVAAYEATVRLSRARLASTPGDAGAMRATAAALRELGWARADLADGEGIDSGLAALSESRSVLEACAAREPASLDLQSELSLVRALTSAVHRIAGRLDEALAEMEASTFLAESVASLDATDPALRLQVVRRLEGMGDTHVARRDPAAAAEAYRRRLDAARTLLPGDAVAEGLACLDLGDALLLGNDAAQACDLLARATVLLRSPAAADIGLLLRLGAAHARLGDARNVVGDRDGAVAAARDAAEVWRRAVTAAPQLAEAYERHASGLLRLADELAARDDLDGAATAAREAFEVSSRRVSAPGAPRGARESHADVAARVAHLHIRTRRPAAAVPFARAALELRRTIAAEAPDDADAALDVCRDAWRVAHAHLGAKEAAPAEEAAREAVALADARTGDPDVSDRWLHAAAAAHDVLGDVLQFRGDGAGAAEHAEIEAALAERRATTLATDAELWNIASLCLREAAWAREVLGGAEPAATLALRERAIAAQRAAVGTEERDPDSARHSLVDALCDMGWALRRCARPEDALARLREALPLAEALRDADLADRSRMALLAEVHGAIDSALSKLERYGEAEPSARIVLGLRRALAEGGDDEDRRLLRWSLCALAQPLQKLGRKDEARPLFEEGLVLCERHLAEHPDDLDGKGLLVNLREGLADLLDRSAADERSRARTLYAGNVELLRLHTPAELHHDDTCTCLADNERKLGELGAA